VGWGDYLVTSRNIVYASIDGRGTGFQSDEFMFKVYRYSSIRSITFSES
jgi:hypothetical protein